MGAGRGLMETLRLNEIVGPENGASSRILVKPDALGETIQALREAFDV